MLIRTHSHVRTALISFLITTLLVLAMAQTAAVPYTYSFNSDWAGTGTFTLDVGTALGTYEATEVSGGPSRFWDPQRPTWYHGYPLGVWTGVTFEAVAGQIPMLCFHSEGKKLAYGGSPVGGGSIAASSSADLEWEFLLAQLPSSYLRRVIKNVPDSAPSWLLTGIVMGGLCVLARLRLVASYG